MARKMGDTQLLGIRLLKLIQNRLDSRTGKSYKNWAKQLFPGIEDKPGELFQIRIQQVKNACADIRYNVRAELKAGKTPPIVIYTVPVETRFDRRLFNARNMPYLTEVLDSLNETIRGLIAARKQLEKMTDAKPVSHVDLTYDELVKYTKPRSKKVNGRPC